MAAAATSRGEASIEFPVWKHPAPLGLDEVLIRDINLNTDMEPYVPDVSLYMDTLHIEMLRALSHAFWHNDSFSKMEWARLRRDLIQARGGRVPRGTALGLAASSSSIENWFGSTSLELACLNHPIEDPCEFGFDHSVAVVFEPPEFYREIDLISRFWGALDRLLGLVDFRMRTALLLRCRPNSTCPAPS
jgi:hypothetical protein